MNRCLLLVCLAAGVLAGATGYAAENPVLVERYLPEGYRLDGTVSYQAALQSALGAGRGGVVAFPPGTYLLDNPAGLRVFSGTTLRLEGVTFSMAPGCAEDGQCFLGEGVEEVRFIGGTVLGHRAQWDPSVNIAGIRLTGACKAVWVQGMTFRDLTSNGIGIFAESADAMAEDVRVDNVRCVNCCNYYGDYLEADKGPAKGSDRKDQGGIALYHVRGFVVRGSLFADSQSDGTHFFQCQNGRFFGNEVSGSKMGGYFLEGCENVMASGNLVSRNGSRGVTIERDSQFCTLEDNIVEFSGREGLWAPDVRGIVVAHNVFRENGRKDDGERDSEIRIDNEENWVTETGEIRIEGNLFFTSAHQEAVVRLTAGVSNVTMRNNTFSGEGGGLALPVDARERGIEAEGPRPGL